MKVKKKKTSDAHTTASEGAAFLLHIAHGPQGSGPGTVTWAQYSRSRRRIPLLLGHAPVVQWLGDCTAAADLTA